MDQTKIALLAIAVLIVAGLYFVFTAEPAVEEPEEVDTTAVAVLLFKGLEFGKGVSEYQYSYSETSDGYVMLYTLTKKGDRGLVELRTPLSNKKLYFLENDTILCIDYLGEEVCSTVKGLAELENYVESLRVKLLDDALIEKNNVDMQFLLANRFVKLDPEIIEKAECSQISYVLDFTDISLREAVRFGIGSNTPKIFNWTMCINNNTGYVHEKAFSYIYEEMLHTYSYKLESFQTTAPEIEPPADITTGAIAKLRNEREQSVKLTACFTDKQGAERNKCVSDLALVLRRTDLCDMAGERRDQCLVSLVPFKKDESICTSIVGISFKDDCYIELAGANKNESYCSNLQNQSKMELCIEAAQPVPPANDTETRAIDIDTLMQQIEDYDKGTNESDNES